MNARRPAVTVLALLLTAAGVAGCGGGAGGSDGGSEGGLSSSGTGDDGAGDSADDAELPDDLVVMDGTDVRVSSLDNTFRVENIQVAPGTSVTWTNDGRNEHDVLPVEGDAWGVEVEGFQPGASYEHTFTEPGVYHYYCSIHGTTTAGMVGTVVVAD
jgi:plastocyanin